MRENLPNTTLPLSTALISVDIVALRLSNGRLQVLTTPARHPKAQHDRALPAGRIDPDKDEQLEHTACRQLKLLTLAEPSWLEQVETIGNSMRDSRGWSLTVVYFALLRNEPALDSPDAQWLDVGTCCKLQLPDLAYDHQSLLQSAIERLCNKIQYTTLPLYLLPDTFTLSDIKEVFQGTLGKAPPMRSIRNRFADETVVTDTGEKRYGSNRPATLYRLKGDNRHRLFNRLYESTQ
ncbi:NUDIX hydrolase [Sansalvadorimonas verongulae]|uniref:NUDIX hydrolase n=1 Tax=Sansalvadorimonas verongulae TaxID=2172824 RepID=UPI0012BCA5AA|nr:NUDIX hydrolase [Sansalvadorimonas verongulae]MTI12751.1 NUDIX hydrolase [Sansalvadorimonas verongulae]